MIFITLATTVCWTVSVAEPETEPERADMTAAPDANELDLPREPAVLLTAATVGTELVQVMLLVKSWVEPSVKVPVA